ncbi:MAG: DUF883 family protein [Deltaproteobacteria bacterium]|nr:DUF883 family protein [Deltaproteobacteria bacterium]
MEPVDLKKARKEAADAAEEVKNVSKDMVENMKAQIQKNPWPYIGGFAAAGLLLGFLLGRRK